MANHAVHCSDVLGTHGFMLAGERAGFCRCPELVLQIKMEKLWFASTLTQFHTQFLYCACHSTQKLALVNLFQSPQHNS